MNFDELQLHPALLKAIQTAGYTTPTPIQEKAIPHIIAGQDVMACAQTGTGKTAAFILPALQKLTQPARKPGRGPRVLVLTPTRELATQVSTAADQYSAHISRAKTVCILGGMPYPLQYKKLSQPFDILVATPGRLIDHLERGSVNFSRLEILVLDEADRMLDMGFINDVERIVEATPEDRQTLLFSATLKGAVIDLAKRMLKNPVDVTVSSPQTKNVNIEQRLHYVDDLNHKNRLLTHVLKDEALNQTIVFTATKRHVDQLVDELCDQGYVAAALHGDMSQRERNRTLMRLRRGDVKVLVATDVAARGIDVPGISHVINFDLPQTTEDYVHRIGRTGRAGANGVALTFASPKDQLLLQKIERYTGQRITPCEIPGLEARFKPGAFNPESQNRGRFGGARRYGNSSNRYGSNRGDRSGASRDGGYGNQRRGRPQAEVYCSDR